MREVSEFVVIFPRRLFSASPEDRDLLMAALGREYPGYKFERYPLREFAHNDEFRVIPMMGVVGDGINDDPEHVYICDPVAPEVIQDLVSTLQLYEGVGAAVN
ncbi:hypothetical protein [Devosia epidermidihirudinis]|nr:hypothetical protein [Devosia epidermidihirudinis]